MEDCAALFTLCPLNEKKEKRKENEMDASLCVVSLPSSDVAATEKEREREREREREKEKERERETWVPS